MGYKLRDGPCKEEREEDKKKYTDITVNIQMTFHSSSMLNLLIYCTKDSLAIFSRSTWHTELTLSLFHCLCKITVCFGAGGGEGIFDNPIRSYKLLTLRTHSRSGWLFTEPWPPQMHWIPVVHCISELFFHVLPLSYHTHISNINGKIHFLTFQCCIILLNLFRQKQTLTHWLQIHFHSKRLRACQKIKKEKKVSCEYVNFHQGKTLYQQRTKRWIVWMQFLPVDRNSLCCTNFLSQMQGY